MVALLAIPVVIPVVIMQVTGTNGAQWVELENNIVAPEAIKPVEPEEVTVEEKQEAFLRIKNATVSTYVGFDIVQAARWAAARGG